MPLKDTLVFWTFWTTFNPKFHIYAVIIYYPYNHEMIHVQDEADNVRTSAELLYAKIRQFVRAHEADLGTRLDLKAELFSCCDVLEGIVNDLKPHVIGVAGGVAVGKTSLINSILGGERGPELLSHSPGETSGVPVEVSSSSTTKFKATIYFLSKEDVSESLQYLARFRSSDDYQVLACKKLMDFLFTFDVQQNINGIHPADPQVYHNVQPISFIGRIPLVLECDSIEGLSDLVKPYMETFDGQHRNAVSQFVKRIVLKGPFVDLPLGIVLVDTPGLKASLLNMRKTTEELSRFDELWFVDIINKAFAERVDKDFVQNFYRVYDRPVHLIGTMGDAVRNSQLEISRRTMVANLAMTGVPNAAENVAMTGINQKDGSRMGYDHILDSLRIIHDQRQAIAADKRNLIVETETRIRQFGYRIDTLYPPIPPNWFDQWLVAFRADIDGGVRAFDALRVSACVNGPPFPASVQSLMFTAWADPNRHYRQFHHNTIKAVMRRGGVFSSPAAGTINLNADITNEWIDLSKISLCSHKSNVERQLQALATLIVGMDMPAAGQVIIDTLIRDFRQFEKQLKAICFGWHTALYVQNYFLANGVYRDGRSTLPNDSELRKLFAGMAACASTNIATCLHLLADFEGKITNFLNLQQRPSTNLVDELSVAMRAALNAMLDEHDQNGISYEEANFTDFSFNFGIFVDPVQICPHFQHVFERQDITQWLNDDLTHGCPLCSFVPNRPVQYVARPDTVAAIRWWRARVQDISEIPDVRTEWWMEPWNAGLAQARADIALDDQAENDRDQNESR